MILELTVIKIILFDSGPKNLPLFVEFPLKTEEHSVNRAFKVVVTFLPRIEIIIEICVFIFLTKTLIISATFYFTDFYILTTFFNNLTV